MRRILVLLIFVLMSNGTVNANSDDRPPPYEQLYTAWGYASIDEALSEFEDHFKKELKLPLTIPPLAFTHQIGIFNNMDGDINDSFEMKLVSEKYPENHYKIDVRLAENSVNFTKREIKNTYKLKDGTVASYISIPQHQVHFYGLAFEKGDWQYILSVDKRIADTVTPEVLVEIANSFEPNG